MRIKNNNSIKMRSSLLLPVFIAALIISGIFFSLSYFNINIASILISKDNQNSISSSVLAQTTECTASDTSNWCQVQHDPQRTGYTPEVLGTNIKVSWTYRFWPEKVFPQVQAIIYKGKVFVGTEMGNMYAFDETASKTQGQAVIAWTYKAGSPILASVAAGDDKIFFGSMDGHVYALNASDGSLAWKKKLTRRHGFSTAPVIVTDTDGITKVLLGARGGVFYALDVNGNKLWEYDTETPILQTPAYNNGRVFFGAMDMYVYALNTSDGTLAWKSIKTDGMAYKDYWPVVHQGYVIVRPMGIGRVNDLAAYDADPTKFTKTMYLFDEQTGQEGPTVQHWDAPVMNGAPPSSCVDRDNLLIVPAYSRWGRLDIATRSLVSTFGAGGNADETENVSCSNNLVIILHHRDHASVAGRNGVFDLDSRTWTWLDSPDRNPQYNTLGSGTNPASISNGMFYHISFNYLITRSTQ